jgi:methionyl-tRNA formyltransferase
MGFRTLYMGTAEIACTPLKALNDHPNCEIVGVLTQPDRPRGRNMKTKSSAVKECAEELGLSVLQPQTLRDDDVLEQLRSLQAELIVVAAFGQILPQSVLDLPKYGAVNIHASILPRHRGAAPIQWAILRGDSETGVTLMKMDEGLDTGDLIAVSRTTIQATDNSQTLHDRLAELGASLLISTLPDYVGGSITAKPQDDSLSTYARKIVKDDGRIDWSLPSIEIHRRIRAFTPWPGAFTFLPVEQRRLLKIHKASITESEGNAGEILSVIGNNFLVACGQKSLAFKELQREGSQTMDVDNFLHGCPLKPGMMLG